MATQAVSALIADMFEGVYEAKPVMVKFVHVAPPLILLAKRLPATACEVSLPASQTIWLPGALILAILVACVKLGFAFVHCASEEHTKQKMIENSE
jgi:hypothetical protein